MLISNTLSRWYKSSLKLPFSISFFISLLDEHIILTSTLISWLPLILLNFWSIKTRKILDWVSSGISEIPLETQSKILRVLIDQKFKRINGDHDISVNVRIICSSSKDIKKEIENGNFREDLYHRLNVFEINIEALKNRVSDIPLLVEYFSGKIFMENN